MNKTLVFLKREFLELLAPTIFFFVVFYIVACMRALMVEQYSIPPKSFAAVVIGALIVGKSILIADALPFIRYFREPRLIYNVLWRCFLYALIILLFQILEELIPLISKYGGFSAAYEHFIHEIRWYRFLATHLILIAFLVTYIVIATVVGEIGHRECFAIFFGKRKDTQHV